MFFAQANVSGIRLTKPVDPEKVSGSDLCRREQKVLSGRRKRHPVAKAALDSLERANLPVFKGKRSDLKPLRWVLGPGMIIRTRSNREVHRQP